MPEKEVNQVGLAHGPTSMYKIWHREEVLMDEFGKLFGWDTEEVSERIWIGSNPDQRRESYQPAYNCHRPEGDQAEAVHITWWQI